MDREKLEKAVLEKLSGYRSDDIRQLSDDRLVQLAELLDVRYDDVRQGT